MPVSEREREAGEEPQRPQASIPGYMAVAEVEDQVGTRLGPGAERNLTDDFPGDKGIFLPHVCHSIGIQGDYGRLIGQSAKRLSYVQGNDRTTNQESRTAGKQEDKMTSKQAGYQEVANPERREQTHSKHQDCPRLRVVEANRTWSESFGRGGRAHGVRRSGCM